MRATNNLSPATGPGAVLDLIRTGHATTRAQIAERTGMARSTVAERVDALTAHDFLRTGGGASTGGRPAAVLAFNHSAGVVLVADLGATHSRVAVTDLAGEVLAESRSELEISAGPEAVLGWLDESFDALLDQAGRPPSHVKGVGVGVPGPVEFATGRPVAPPTMPGWDAYPVAERLRARFGGTVLVDNDVNVMTRGEHVAIWPDAEHLLFVKVATGIGAGIIAGGRIHRGEHGAAGDIGHIRVSDRDDLVCSCGNTGCLEAVAGGRALARRLAEAGLEATTSRDVVRHARAGHPEAVRLVRQAGRTLGEVLAACVNMFNPTVIVIGGDMAEAHEQLFAGVREIVYQRSLPLATRTLRITGSQLGDRAGIVGAAVMVIDEILSPAAVDAALAAAS